MTRLPRSALAASLLGVGFLLTGCASGGHGVQTTPTTGDYHPVPVRTAAASGYSVAAVKAAFSSVGVDLRPFPSSGAKPSGTWVDLIGNQAHPIHVNVRLGPYRGRWNHLTYTLSAVGSNRAEYRNVLLGWRPDDQAVVMAALRRLR
jgi:hypothetical protein